MIDDEALDDAPADGFELIERMRAGQWEVGWTRGADDRWSCFLHQRQALNLTPDQLNRGRVFL
ncbi:MAG TPA: hypothetical protein VIA11_22425 [Acidimicrobiia bacterium]|nr:hypothetical protein [Acidimicrobiia bacterium]